MTDLTIYTNIESKERPRARIIAKKFAQIYTPQKTKKYEMFIANAYQQLGGEHFMNKPVIVRLYFYFKVPASWPKFKQWAVREYETNINALPELFVNCMNIKDIDNIAKSVLDALNGVAYSDDKQVVSLQINKYWTMSDERIRIEINDLIETPEDKLKSLYKNATKVR